MSHQVFVPVTDDLIYNHPERIEGPLVPYAAGMECHEWLSIEINPDESETAETMVSPVKSHRVSNKVSNKVSNNVANLRLAYSA